jgi:hypothetical protein
MGRKSREHREKREQKATQPQNDRAAKLEEDLKILKDGDAVFWTSHDCPADLRESNLEDILAFESVESGTSLFDGLQEHGIDLPHPEKLDEQQSAGKITEVLLALEELQVFLIGFEGMSARQFYWTLWNQTLWEGCYVKKRNPGALTIIDVSHSIPRSEILRILEESVKAGSVH